MKSLLQDNYIEIYSTRIVGKSFVAESFVRTLKNKIYKCMMSVSKNVYIDKLDDIVNKYNIIYSAIKIKPADVKSNTYIDFNKEKNDEYPNVFAKGYVNITVLF